MQTNTQFDEQKIKKYLYGEMLDAERDAMEDEFFDNDELFVEIAETENLLVDLYARKQLSSEELIRFESSLAKFPERRSKVANAAALRTFIDAERVVEEPETVVVGQTFWQKIADFFTVKSPAFGYSMASILLLFAIATVFLLIDNQRKKNEIANLQNQQKGGWEQKQKELEDKLANLNANLEDLKAQSEQQGKENDRFFGEVASKTEQVEQVQKELDQLKKEKNITPSPTPKQPVAPTFATYFFLTPSISTRGGSGSTSRSLSTSREAKQITIGLALPDDFEKDARLSIKLNDKIVASNLPAQKNLQIKIPAADVAEGLNKISIVNAEGKEISKYIFNMQKK